MFGTALAERGLLCNAADGRSLQAVLAEITDTPWGERHCYAVAAGPGGARGTFAKRFHVSPFQGMEQGYRWSFGVPGPRLRVEMRSEEAGREVFRAALSVRRQPWSAAAAWRAALRHPLMAWKVHLAIYWQALLLWVKQAPVHSHPGPHPAAGSAPRSIP